MWTISLRRLLALLLCLLLLFSVTAQSYTITEAELLQLETALQTAMDELSISQGKLSALQARLQTLLDTSNLQAQSLAGLSRSFEQFVKEGQTRLRWMTLALIGTSSLCVVLALR